MINLLFGFDRSQSEPQFVAAMEGFRESPDVFQTFHGFIRSDIETGRDVSPPPGFIDEPSTPLPADIGGTVLIYLMFL